MRIFTVGTLAAALFVAAWAQFDSGQIAGFVRDPSQSVIVGATVTAVNEGNSAKQHATTNASGYYVFPNLFVGIYRIEVKAPGFKKFVRSGVKLSSADKLSLDIETAVGSVAETVDVTASAPARLSAIPASIPMPCARSSAPGSSGCRRIQVSHAITACRSAPLADRPAVRPRLYLFQDHRRRLQPDRNPPQCV